MRVYIDGLVPSTVADSIQTHGAPRDPVCTRRCRLSRIYSERGILVVDDTGIHHTKIVDARPCDLGIGSRHALTDSSTIDYIGEVSQIPVPHIEVEVDRCEYSVPECNKTKFVVEIENKHYSDCYFDTTQESPLVAKDIATLLSFLKFC